MTTTQVDIGADLASRLRLAIARLNRQLRQASAGLTLSQLSAMATISKEQPIRLSDLAGREGIAAPTATRVVASLEEAGLVTRRTSPDDKRASLLTISARGQKTLERLHQHKTALLRQRLQDCSDTELTALLAALPVLERLAETEG